MSDPNDPNPPQGSGDVPPPPPPASGGSSAPPPPPPPSDPYGGAGAGTGAGGYAGPPPPSAPYGQPADASGANGPYSVGNAFNYGWTKFQANLGPIILGVIAIVVAVGIVEVIGLVAVGGLSSQAHVECSQVTGQCHTTGGGFSAAALFLWFILTIVGWLVSLIIGAGIVRGALDITYGRPVEVKTIFRADNLAQVVIASIIIGIAVSIGTFLCVIPGLIVAFFTQYTLFFLVDKQMPAMEAIRASASFVNKNLGSLVGFYIAAVIAVFVGFLVCYVGSLVAIPVVIIAAAFTYRRLQGETVAA
jgi:uncharacterized membrane protein